MKGDVPSGFPALGGSLGGRLGRGKRQVVAPSVQKDAGHPVPIPFGLGRQGDGRAPKVFRKARAAFTGVPGTR